MLAVIKPLQCNRPPDAGVKSWPLEINHALGREEHFSDMKAEMETIIFCDYPRGRSKRKKKSPWIADNFLWWPIPRRFRYNSCSVTKWGVPRPLASKNSTSGCHNASSEASHPLEGPCPWGSKPPSEDNGVSDCARSDELCAIVCFSRKVFYEGTDWKYICFKPFFSS